MGPIEGNVLMRPTADDPPRSKHEPDKLAVAAYIVLAISFAAIAWTAAGLLGLS